MIKTNTQTMMWCGLILFCTALLKSSAMAQSVPRVCPDSPSNSYNASAERTINGFYSNRTYSFFTAVNEVFDFELNQSTIFQNYWMRSEPIITTPSQDLPFGGCLLVLSQRATANLQPDPSINNPEGVTACEAVLPRGCNDAWLRQLNDSVTSFPRNQLNDTWLSCQDLNLTMPYECGSAFYNNSAPIAAFGTPFSSSLSDVSCSGDINIFNGSSTQNTYARDSQNDLAAMLQVNLNTSNGNNTVYDYFVRRTNAVFMAAWPRWPGSETEAPVVASVCLSPEEHILNNSRDPANGVSAIKTIPLSAVFLGVVVVYVGLNLT